jgi:hypothetical protein
MTCVRPATSVRRVTQGLLLLCLTNSAAFCAEGEISAADREHWAFQPVTRPAVPAANSVGKTPLDAFVTSALHSRGLKLSSEADRRTLIRRLKLDLLGLPPTPDETEDFVADESEECYERLVDRYLADPHYGERWGRYWLDLVRYADTAGYKSDEDRPLAYRYRDYVVRSFNSNLPYDRFVAEQLAGDELEPDSEQAIVATGYLRLWPDESNASDVQKARQDALNDITSNVGAAFLGLTLGCAQCHDHKFDPILQADFYELQAYFAGILPEDRVPVSEPERLARFDAELAEWTKQADPLRKQLYDLELPARQKASHVKRLKFPADVIEAIDVRPEERTTRQRQLAFWAERQVDKEIKESELEKHLSEPDRVRRKELVAQLAALDASKPPAPPFAKAMAVVDSDAGPAESFLLITGTYDSAFDEVRPKGLSVLEPVSTAAESLVVSRPGSSGRRAALAAWLTDPSNPLPARVMVNRLWQGHFGQGLVSNANDFGVQTPEPVLSDLLDWLAAEFVASGWDIKHVHRLIVTSAVYRQEGALAAADPAAVVADPDNTLFWHYPRRRLDAEAIRDSLMLVTGRLAEGMYGPGVRPELPEGFETGEPWEVNKIAQERDRRSVYVYAKRNLPHPFLAAFDLPDMHEACGCRVTTTTAPQALTMLNGSHVLAAAKGVAKRALAGSLDPAQAVERAFELTLGRLPDDDERKAALDFVHAQEERIHRPGDDFADAHAIAVTDLCHALLNANEFLYLE